MLNLIRMGVLSVMFAVLAAQFCDAAVKRAVYVPVVACDKVTDDSSATMPACCAAVRTPEAGTAALPTAAAADNDDVAITPEAQDIAPTAPRVAPPDVSAPTLPNIDEVEDEPTTPDAMPLVVDDPAPLKTVEKPVSPADELGTGFIEEEPLDDGIGNFLTGEEEDEPIFTFEPEDDEFPIDGEEEDEFDLTSGVSGIDELDEEDEFDLSGAGVGIEDEEDEEDVFGLPVTAPKAADPKKPALPVIEEDEDEIIF